MGISLGILAYCPPSLGQKLELGLSLAEEGDDRLHPALTIHYEVNNLMLMRLHHYGMNLDPIKERSTLLGMGYIFPFMKEKTIRGALGLAYLRDEIKLPDQDYSGGSYQADNVGLMLGIFWCPWKGLPITIAWESNLFLAGPSSILLTTARRQMVGLSGGFTW